jgi:hypothetical protein
MHKKAPEGVAATSFPNSIGTTRSLVVLGVIVALCVAVAAYQTTAFYRGYAPSAGFTHLWGGVFAALLAIWVEEDSRGRPDVGLPSLDLGLFMFLMWFLLLPWYLLRTRGPKGWLWIAGLFAAAFLASLLQLLIFLIVG